MARAGDFRKGVPLPSGLTIAALRRSIDYIERELAELVDIYFEQANVFSALVGIYGVRALDSFSVYEKSRHRDIAQQRFPDLKRRGTGVQPPARLSLESKGSKRPWELHSMVWVRDGRTRAAGYSSLACTVPSLCEYDLSALLGERPR